MKKCLLAVALSLAGIATGRGVILLDTGDPNANTTAPSGALAGSGWQHEGDWGGFLGTPIAPNFFISAAHIGHAGSTFSFQDTNYQTTTSFWLPGSDLLIWKVAGTFNTFAPVYTKRDEAGRHLVVIGRGTRRGSEIMLDGTLRGWNWGDGDGVRRWGENDVSGIAPYQGHDLLYANFDQHNMPNDRPNECHLSVGDSGGAVFLNEGGAWKLAGINFAVDGLYRTPSSDSEFEAAVFDARGFYTTDPNDPSMFVQIMDPDPVPTAFYASRISSELAWIASVIADPQIGREGNSVVLTYWRLTVPTTDIVYAVQQSGDFVSWSTATPVEQILATAGDLEQVKATIDPEMADHLLVRLKVTRP